MSRMTSVAWLTSVTKMTKMPWVTRMTKMTGVTKMTSGLTRLIMMTRMTK